MGSHHSDFLFHEKSLTRSTAPPFSQKAMPRLCHSPASALRALRLAVNFLLFSLSAYGIFLVASCHVAADFVFIKTIAPPFRKSARLIRSAINALLPRLALCRPQKSFLLSPGASFFAVSFRFFFLKSHFSASLPRNSEQFFIAENFPPLSRFAKPGVHGIIKAHEKKRIDRSMNTMIGW